MTTAHPRRYTTKEAADRIQVRKNSLMFWLKKVRVPEPRLRDRNGPRIWTDADLARQIAYRDRPQPAPSRPLAVDARVPKEVNR